MLLKVQILAINDFHGQLEPPSGTLVTGYNETGAPIHVDARGAEYLATHIKSLRSENPNTFVVTAGDSIGASPLVSGMFHDEPTVKALNMMGFDNFSVLKAETERVGGAQDIDAFVNYFEVFSPVGPGPKDRIALVNELSIKSLNLGKEMKGYD